MARVLHHCIRLLPAGVAVMVAIFIVIAAWQVPAAQLPIASWVLWMALCWRIAPEPRS